MSVWGTTADENELGFHRYGAEKMEKAVTLVML